MTKFSKIFSDRQTCQVIQYHLNPLRGLTVVAQLIHFHLLHFSWNCLLNEICLIAEIQSVNCLLVILHLFISQSPLEVWWACSLVSACSVFSSSYTAAPCDVCFSATLCDKVPRHQDQPGSSSEKHILCSLATGESHFDEN